MGYCSIDGYSNRTTCEAAGGTWTDSTPAYEFAYYLEGNKLAIVQRDSNFDNNVSSKEFGPGVSRVEWDSPRTTITDGLQIKYAYSPDYMISVGASVDGNMIGRTKLAFSGWYVDSDNYLVFTTVSESLTSTPFLITDAPYTIFGDNDYIHVTNSSRWNGVHKVKDDLLHGKLQTYTKVNRNEHYNSGALSDTIADLNIIQPGSAGDAGAYLSGTDGSDVFVNLNLKVGDFVWVHLLDEDTDEGLYKVTSITETDGGAESAQRAYLGKKYFLNHEDTIDEFQSGTDHFTADTGVKVWKVNYDPCYISSDVNVLDSEADEIDLPSYLTKALVYYVKSRVAEDAGNFEVKEYMEREFKQMIEKFENSRISGPRMISPGSHAIR